MLALQPAKSLRWLAILFTIVAQAAHEGSFFRISARGGPLVSEMVDPIMSPAVTPSNHVHEVFGGDGWKPDWTFNNAKGGSCNNMGPTSDFSNYWFPALYHQGGDGSFTRVPAGLIVYYHFGTEDNGPRRMFPPGLRILAGNAMLRHDDSATNKATESIQWHCHEHDDEKQDTKKKVAGFPDGVTSCPKINGFSTHIWFPFCWDGSMDFDPKDPLAHVVYGDGKAPNGGNCSGPEGKHTTPLPQIFMEMFFHIDQVTYKPGSATPWVLAQGDPTGAGFHADFINGWVDGERSLSGAMKPVGKGKTKCMVGLSDNPLTDCLDMLPMDKQNGCPAKIKPVKQVEVDRPGKNLPGCNPIQPASQQDAKIQTNCDGYTAPTKRSTGHVE